MRETDCSLVGNAFDVRVVDSHHLFVLPFRFIMAYHQCQPFTDSTGCCALNQFLFLLCSPFLN